jgi:hypothetical protein
LLVAGLFWEKSTAGWWLISRKNRLSDTDHVLVRETERMHRFMKTVRLWPSASDRTSRH